MKTLILFLALYGAAGAQAPVGAKPSTRPAASVPVTPASQVTREKAWEYLTLTRRAEAMEKNYKARFIDSKGAKPVPDEMKKKHLLDLNNMLIKLVQTSFSPASLDAVLAFLKTPAGERWAEDAATFNEEFRDESTELLNQFAEDIKEANDAASEEGASPLPAGPTAPKAMPGR
jgi:hypothetical protein